MGTNFSSSTVSAGDDALATQYNNLRSDMIKNGGDFEVTGGTGSAYTLAIDASISSYSEGDKFRMQLHTDCGDTPTLNVNSIGAKTIKRNHDEDITAGDFLTDQIIEVVYQANDDIFEVITSSAISGGTNKLSLDASDVTISNDATETNLASFSVPANTLSTSNIIRIEIPITDLDISRNNDVHFHLKYGSTTIATITIDNIDSGIAASTFSNYSGKIEALLFGTGATNTQEGSIKVTVGNYGCDPNTNQGQHLTDVFAGTAAEDSTGALTLSITARFSTASPSNNITIPHYIATVIR